MQTQNGEASGLVPEVLHHRLTLSLAEYLRDFVKRGLDEVAVPDAVDTDIDRFRDAMIADGTVMRLHELLSHEFQVRHEEQTGAKLHLLHNATDQTIERLDVVNEKTHDSTLFKTGSWTLTISWPEKSRETINQVSNQGASGSGAAESSSRASFVSSTASSRFSRFNESERILRNMWSRYLYINYSSSNPPQGAYRRTASTFGYLLFNHQWFA